MRVKQTGIIDPWTTPMHKYRPERKRPAPFRLQVPKSTLGKLLVHLRETTDALQKVRAENAVLEMIYAAAAAQPSPTPDLSRALAFANDQLEKPLVISKNYPEEYKLTALYAIAQAREVGMSLKPWMEFFRVSFSELKTWERKYKGRARALVDLRRLIGVSRYSLRPSKVEALVSRKILRRRMEIIAEEKAALEEGVAPLPAGTWPKQAATASRAAEPLTDQTNERAEESDRFEFQDD